MATIELAMIDIAGDQNAVKVLKHCERIMPVGFFNAVTMFAPAMESAPSAYRHIKVNLLPCPDNMRHLYQVWRMREMPRSMVCDYAMFIHKDGYILNPDKWTDEFLGCDYIGAPWNTTDVGGNNSFHIRSSKLAKFIANMDVPYDLPEYGEDAFICKVHHNRVTSAGFKFAPLDLALKFSLESHIPEHPRTTADVFGFHGKHILQTLPPLP
jgi:hypothetical protein